MTSRTSGTNGASGTSRVSKARRQRVVSELLLRHDVTSQEQLVDLLAGENLVSTQATVSRDLLDLGAMKFRTGAGELIYKIPEQPHEQRAPEDHLRRVFGEWVVEVARSGDTIVLRTPPGSAHVVGSALDRSDLPDVLGTVAGDDTLIVVVRERAGARTLRALRDLAGLAPASPERT